MSYLKKNFGFFRIFPGFFGFFRVFSGCKLKFWVGLGSRSIQELRVGSGFSLGLKVWVGLGHKLGKILGLLWVKALVTFRFSGWVGSGFFGFFANSTSETPKHQSRKSYQIGNTIKFFQKLKFSQVNHGFLVIKRHNMSLKEFRHD